jgi:hypothetical protein
MVLFGEGIDHDIDKALGAEGSTAAVIREETRNAIASAQRGNVTVYSVDPRGLFDPADELVQSATQVSRDSRGDPAQARLGEITELNNRGQGRKPPPTEANTSTLQAEVRLQQDSLRALARDTGGFPVLNTNGFVRRFERIIRENSRYYLIGYNSTNDKRDGRLRTLQVRVKRPGLTVRAQRLYGAGFRHARIAASRRHGGLAGTRGSRQPAAGERHPDAGVCGALQGTNGSGDRYVRNRDRSVGVQLRIPERSLGRVARDGDGDRSGRRDTAARRSFEEDALAAARVVRSGEVARSAHRRTD